MVVICSMIYSIRPATHQDRDSILDITSRYQFNINGDNNYTGTLIPLTTKKISPLIDAEMFYVAMESDWNDNGNVVGCVSLVDHGTTFELRSLAVREGYRKQDNGNSHLGSALVYTILQKAEMMGADKVYVLARKDNQELIRFFKSHGFRYTDRWPEKLDNDCTDCLVRDFCMEDAMVADLRSSGNISYFSSDDRFYL